MDEANDGLEAVGGFVIATAQAADNMLGMVTDLADSITIPLPEVEIPAFTIPVINVDIDLPDFSLGAGELVIPIPGIEPLQDLANRLVAAGATVTEPITKLAELSKVPPQLEQAAKDTAEYAGEVRSTMAGWLKAVLLLLVLGALLWVAAQARPITSELATGVRDAAGPQAAQAVEGGRSGAAGRRPAEGTVPPPLEDPARAEQEVADRDHGDEPDEDADGGHERDRRQPPPPVVLGARGRASRPRHAATAPGYMVP